AATYDSCLLCTMLSNSSHPMLRFVLFPTIRSLSFFSTISFFFFNDTATTEIYTLSLHDALPIYTARSWSRWWFRSTAGDSNSCRSEEHTSELQSLTNLVCRLLLEKKKITEKKNFGTEETLCDQHADC